MANNRVYLWCPCGDRLFLAKTVGLGYHGVERSPDVDYCDFLSAHSECEEAVTRHPIWGPDCLQVELRFEHHDNKDRELPEDK